MDGPDVYTRKHSAVENPTHHASPSKAQMLDEQILKDVFELREDIRGPGWEPYNTGGLCHQNTDVGRIQTTLTL